MGFTLTSPQKRSWRPCRPLLLVELPLARLWSLHLGPGACSDPFAQEGFSCIHPPGGCAGWASHKLKLGERSSSSSGDNQDFKENFKNTSCGDSSRPRTLHRRLIGMVSLRPTCATLFMALQPGGAGGGCRHPQLLHAACSAVPAPGPAHHALTLLLVAQNSGMKCSAGAGGARSLQVSNQPWRNGHRWAATEPISRCRPRLLIAFGGGGVLLFGTASAKWTLHKLCTLVQSKLSICELSYLMLRMKTSKRGGGGF